MVPVLEDVEVEHGAIACWQLTHHPQDLVRRDVADGWIILFRFIGHIVVQQPQFLPFCIVQESQRLIDDDSRCPSLERACSSEVEVGDVGDDADERLLKHVLHILMVRDVACADTRQLVCIERIKLPHRPVFTVAKPLCQALFIRNLYFKHLSF